MDRVDDTDIRWSKGAPNPAQRAMEAHVLHAIAQHAEVSLAEASAGIWVEGMISTFPIVDVDSFRRSAGAMFQAVRSMVRECQNPIQFPAHIFMFGCGPGSTAVFRVVTGDVETVGEVAPAVGRRFGGDFVLLTHVSILPRGKGGGVLLDAVEHAQIGSIVKAGGDHTALPYGYEVHIVGRMFGWRDGPKEFSTYWIQGVDADAPLNEEEIERLTGSYSIVQVDQDGNRVATGDETPAAEA